MGALPKTRMTVDEFLLWAQTQESGRYELIDGQVVMMSPETLRHVRVKGEAWLAFRNALVKAGVPCTAFMDGASVRINEYELREPDISIQCRPDDPDSLVLEAPVVLVEVVSPSTSRNDTGAKVGEYFGIATLRHYLIIDPVHRSVIRHSRLEGSEKLETEIHRTGYIELDSPGITVDVADLLGPALDSKTS
jgi:Uma2 family endonuclease